MKMSKNKFVGILAILLVILLVLVGIVYSRTDLLKSPKTLFNKYIAQNLEVCPKIDYYGMLDKIKDVKDKDYIASGDISIKVDGENTESMKPIEDLKLNYKVVKAKQDSDSEINVMYSDKEVLKVNTKSEGKDKVGIKIDGIYDKYIGVENRNLKELMKKLGLNENGIPDKIESVDLYDLLYISKEDIDTIKENYSSIIENAINNEKYTTNRNIETTVNEKTVKANSYSLKLNEKETLELEKQILETLKNDEMLLNLIESKAKKIDSTNTEYTKEKIREEVDKKINEVELNLKDADENTYTEIIVYEVNGKTVKTELKEDENELTIELERENSKISAKLTDIEDGKEINEIKINKDESATETTKSLEYKVEVNEEGTKSNIGMSYIQSDDKTKANITFGTDEAEISFIINGKMEYTSNESVEKINDENTIILNDKTQEELAKILEDMITNAQNLLIEKAKLFGIDENDL